MRPGAALATAALVGLALVGLALGRAGAEEPSRCALACPGERCYLEATSCLIAAGDARAAKRMLKQQALAAHPASVVLRLQLARVYGELGNAAWRRRTLYQARAAAPRHCQVRAWLIWQHLSAAELDEAASLLDEPGCRLAGPVRGRYALLAATLARYRELPAEVRPPLRRALDQTALFAEDHELLRDLLRAATPRRPTPLTLRVDLGVGYSSNALMSAPVDLRHSDQATSEAAPSSPLLALDASARLEPPWTHRPLRPLLEGDLRSLLLLRRADAGVASPLDYSYLSLALRPGIALGRAGAARLFYAVQLLLLAGEDAYSEGKPRWFFETHRAELEWEPLRWLSLWGGAGRATFREQGRTRTELDLGVGLLFNPWRDLRLLVGLSGRRHWARHQRYDLVGGTLLASLTKPLAATGLTARGRVLAALDHFPRSAGLFADSATDREPGERRDLLLKGALELWSPSIGVLRLAIGYEVSGRASTADAYDFSDHRLVARLRLSLEADPWLPDATRGGPGHVRLPYGAQRGDDRGSPLDEERIQSLLRQEDTARRGSSCID